MRGCVPGQSLPAESSLISLMYRMSFPSRELFLLVLLRQSFGICSHHRRVGGSIGGLSLSFHICIAYSSALLFPSILPHWSYQGPVLSPLASDLKITIAMSASRRPNMEASRSSPSVISKTGATFCTSEPAVVREEYINLRHFLSGVLSRRRDPVLL